jgi:hypothetical protein
MDIPGAVQPDVGKLKYHLACPHHRECGVVDTLGEALRAAKAHIVDRHSDSQGKPAPGAELTITPRLHFTTADLENVPAE